MWHPPSPHSANKQPAVCAMDQPYPTRRVVPPLSPMEEPSNNQLASAMFSRRCVPQSPPHARRPLLNFPPPPTYPPPHPVRDDMAMGFPSPGCPTQEHMIMFPAHPSQTLGREDMGKVFHSQQPMREDLNMPGPSHQRMPQMHTQIQPQPSTSWDTGEPHIMPNDYSYAYYEPGPPTRHTNVPSRHPITSKQILLRLLNVVKLISKGDDSPK